MPEYEVDHPDGSDSDASARSLDSEFGVPIMQTPGIKKALISAKIKHCRSSWVKNPITRYAYNEYLAHDYAFTINAAAEPKPENPSLRHMSSLVHELYIYVIVGIFDTWWCFLI